MNIIIGNLVSLFASMVWVASGYAKTRNRTLTLQTVNVGLNALSCLILTAYSGAVINLISVPRNILAQKGKLKTSYKIVILFLIISLSCVVTLQKSKAQGYLEWIGFVPLIATTSYTVLMDKLEGISFKFLVIFTLVVWSVHDFVVKNYVAVLFNILNIFTSVLAIYRIRHEELKGISTNQTQ